MNELRLNELLNKIYYEYLDSHEAEEFIIYFKRLKQDKDNLQSKIDKAIELLQLLHYKFKDEDSIHNEIEDIQKVLKEDK
jgi:MoxR-like ATPase